MQMYDSDRLNSGFAKQSDVVMLAVQSTSHNIKLAAFAFEGNIGNLLLEGSVCL
jgi:hypothetical protein